MRFSSDLERQLNGYGMTTAHILYRIPDFESVLQTYVWQDYDAAPDFPEMHKFLAFWQANLDGPLHSVRYTYRRLVGPSEWRRVEGEFKIH
ncbi:usg protein [Rhizobium rhizogenes]|uniref:usg protein n=1 Tax=Rhizobium rhizogenes TaxID=359 RepID=UPI0015741E3B|nr:aspartate-semialdehyde dehydrogenase [Rhizobium rhizogenes]NTH23037.1 aspartate-semialdehyde dehydrogenase [Rhizobium rhizogenes]NTH36067.1 aspartate-semialdehyde dehydrogenase [Rhizobium rhizogenes]